MSDKFSMIDNPTKKLKILSVQIEHDTDDCPDFSTLGEYTDKQEPWYLIAVGEHKGKFIAELGEDDELPEKGRNYRYFAPAENGETPGSEDYKKYARQDFERMEAYNRQEWGYVGVIAKARIVSPQNVIQTIHSGGLWGIESDAGDYFKEVENDQLHSLKQELLALGFKKRAIEYAFKNVSRKGC